MTNHEKLTLSPRDNGYIRRFTRVIEYIYANLDEDPDLATLAEVAALSPSHWHRVWQSTTSRTTTLTTVVSTSSGVATCGFTPTGDRFPRRV